MPKLNAEPPVLTTMQAVLETAARMEQEAIDGYRALRQRMLDENQPALATVFDRLIAEEESHLRQVDIWAAETAPADRTGTIAAPDLSPMFDAEGADMVPPETLDAYRAFSAAVRNEERAFVFWSYVAAQAPNADVRQAAEKMAREELGHVATMRRERRLAFHVARAEAPPGDAPDIIGLEDHFLKLLASLPEWRDDRTLQGFAEETRERIAAIPGIAFRRKPRLSGQLDLALGRPVTLCGILLDYYLDLMNCEKNEPAVDFAGTAASQLVRCLAFLRNLGSAA
ncbi:ferritin family protein [Agrobacterium tumefaciens]|uniref:ferritin-like domain-containing protein n=1 Tax=Agrobacterium tumefaciens TaxID=358 RepID=UPI0015747DAD|nr:ferritin family protein [Agrobacterium tumefaciens]NTE57956.1 ferritin family protein [Agrobacterium tumefaciens]NTE58009.1 ferritin family protein [Agrobacterium tumefaciens]NTE74759.1 ferritin family protein [Agrobacterium tumefaciens]NTE74812.1 ferritin family protein [Agrobacterium tumefaciens]